MTSPWLTTEEAAEYLRFLGKHKLRSLYRFLTKHNIPTARRGQGGAILIARRDLEVALHVAHRKAS